MARDGVVEVARQRIAACRCDDHASPAVRALDVGKDIAIRTAEYALRSAKFIAHKYRHQDTTIPRARLRQTSDVTNNKCRRPLTTSCRPGLHPKTTMASRSKPRLHQRSHPSINSTEVVRSAFGRGKLRRGSAITARLQHPCAHNSRCETPKSATTRTRYSLSVRNRVACDGVAHCQK